MKYTVNIAGQTIEVDVTADAIRVDGRLVDAALRPVPHTPLRRTVVNGKANTFALSRVESGWSIQYGGETWTAEVLDDRSRRLRELSGTSQRSAQAGIVTAPMPGLVLRVEVEVGQEVTRGSGLVVIEAMKMENEIRAPGGGEVKRVLVEPGEAVEKGAPLVEVGPGVDPNHCQD